ncbi:TPA: hypothetical protein L9Y94_001876 [Klebsiella pneumoniae]|nr:hypothetical protein [Klebsiella pneumoniae]
MIYRKKGKKNPHIMWGKTGMVRQGRRQPTDKKGFLSNSVHTVTTSTKHANLTIGAMKQTAPQMRGFFYIAKLSWSSP